MTPNIGLGRELGELTKDNLIASFNRTVEKADIDEERVLLMDRFSRECPGLYEFIMAVDESEKELIKNEGSEAQQQEIDSCPDQFSEMAHAMLLGFLTLKGIASAAELSAMFEV